MIFIDTNYLLRYFRDDILSQSLIVKSLFKDAVLGKVKLFSSTIVFFEIFWVVDSFYGNSKKDILEILRNLMSMNFIFFDEREVLMEALLVFENTNLELEDCYNISYSKQNNATGFKTFDKRLNNYLKKQKQ